MQAFTPRSTPFCFNYKQSTALQNENQHHAASRAMAGMQVDSFDVQAARSALGASGRELPEGIRVEKTSIAGIPCVHAIPENSSNQRLLVYIHGGGYCAGSWDSHCGHASWMAHFLNCDVVFPEYRLAPEHRFPAAFEDCLAVLSSVIETCEHGQGKSLVLAGDSAGAGLCVAITRQLLDDGQRSPQGLALMCGMFDLNPATGDYLMKYGRAREMAALYVNPEDVVDPTASPILTDLSGFPPMLIQSGGADYIKDDSIRMVKRAFDCDAPVVFEHWPEMSHVWQRFVPDVPESISAVSRAAEFLMDSCK